MSSKHTWFEITLTFDEDIKRDFPGTPNQWKGLLRSAGSSFTIDRSEYASTKKTLFKWCHDIGFTKYQPPFDYFEQNKHAWFNLSIYMSLKTKPDSIQCLAFLKLMFLFGFLDDYLEHLLAVEDDAKPIYYETAEILRTTLLGKYDSVDQNCDLFVQHPFLRTCMDAYADFDKDCVESVQNYRKNSDWFVLDMVQWVRGVTLGHPRITKQVDCESYFVIRLYDSGTYPTASSLLLLNGIECDSTLREDIGFGRLLTLYGQIVASVNDMNGSVRKIQLEKGNSLNYFLYQGQSLTDALDNLLGAINQKLVAFETAKMMFRESCPDEYKHMVEDIIEILSLLADGHTLCYPQCWERYGVCKIKI